jgi:flavin reductase (DIM6/NTAB) family NADH-FMN oxidoreductase RutF
MAVDSQVFKETLAHWASGVSVVTTLTPARAVGITASSLTSVSLQPPQVLICVGKRLYTNQAILAQGAFAASILAEDQLSLGMRFAGLIPELEDRFIGVETFTAVTGCPILTGALAWVDCRVHQVYDGDDHTIFVGEVLAAGSSNQTTPLLYYNRHWRHLASSALTP